jgi:hypothetical protein
LLVLGRCLGRCGLDMTEVPAVLVVEASGHSAAEFQPVLFELPHVCPFLLPGRAVCPALGTGGRWTPWHAERAPGASGRANEVGHAIRSPATAGSGAGLVGGALAAGVGHASTVRPDPSTLGVAGERGSHHEGRSGPFQATHDESGSALSWSHPPNSRGLLDYGGSADDRRSTRACSA